MPLSGARLTRQVRIAHLSDLHFGPRHYFRPPTTPMGDTAKAEGRPTLSDKLLEDLVDWVTPQDAPGLVGIEPLLLCVTGDLTEHADIKQFDEAADCLLSLRDKLRAARKDPVELFLVPGNHDTTYTEEELRYRWAQWTRFYNKVFAASAREEDPWSFGCLVDRSHDLGLVVMCINSSIWVQKGSFDENRGQVDERQLTALHKQLKALDPESLRSAVRIALIHHHPVLIPALAEPKRSYDAVVGSVELLRILHHYDFHLLMHGHKHHPHFFTEDVVSGFETSPHQTMMVLAGGTVGSTELPTVPPATPVYNRVTLKWHPNAGRTRVRVELRGLSRFDDQRRPIIPSLQTWETLREDDRSFGLEVPPTPDLSHVRRRSFDSSADDDSFRIERYRETRGNMPIVEVRPSLLPGQEYEARFWLVQHPSKQQPAETPVEVEWSAGKNFAVLTVAVSDSGFCGRYDYYGPMLIQCRMTFREGKPGYAWVYAHIPHGRGSKENGT